MGMPQHAAPTPAPSLVQCSHAYSLVCGAFCCLHDRCFLLACCYVRVRNNLAGMCACRLADPAAVDPSSPYVALAPGRLRAPHPGRRVVV